VLAGWAGVSVAAATGPLPLTLAAIPVLSWLYTGLFIVGHDAMHGSLAPGRPRLERAVGRLVVMLHAGFDFDLLRAQHLQHHAAPASAADPDHHRGDARPLPWMWGFLTRYLTVAQFIRLSLFSVLLTHGFGLDYAEMLLVWAVPSVLSTVQLFVFGIWRPHREGPTPWPDELRARTDAFPRWLSLLTCFHFGYHREHHAWPFLPWWRLPEARAAGGA